MAIMAAIGNGTVYETAWGERDEQGWAEENGMNAILDNISN
jgi:hypothetical protein